VGVLLLGAPGAGKSDLALRLIGRGFSLVADDRVVIANGIASAPLALAGRLEIRGLGIISFHAVASALIVLAVQLTHDVPRLPAPSFLPDLDVPMIFLDARAASADFQVEIALDAVLGRRQFLAGPLAPEQ
jgi:HPr kinase/phosphorylase